MSISLIQAFGNTFTKSHSSFLFAVFTVILLFGTTSIAQAQTLGSETTTVLIYMVSSDLENKPWFSATKDINEMKKAAIDNPNLNVIVQVGGSDKKGNLNEDREFDYTTSTRFSIQGNQVNIIENLGKINTGLSDTLSDFLIWGIENYPADKYHVILWDHGSGSKGYGKDMNFDYTLETRDNRTIKLREKLLLNELSDAFAAVRSANNGLKFDLIGFDSCLMANIEVANMLTRYGNYLVASESIEPSEGWDYTEILSSLNKDPNQSSKTLGETIATTFLDHHKNLSLQDEYTERETLSVIDLSKIPLLYSAFREIENKMNAPEFVETYAPLVLKAKNQAERYGDQYGEPAKFVDVKHMYEKLGQEIPEIKSDTDKIGRLVDEAVVFAVSVDTKPNANGINIFEPLTAINERLGSGGRASFDEYEEISYTVYLDYIASDVIPPELTAIDDGLNIVGEFDENDIATFSMKISESLTDWHIENRIDARILAMTEINPYDFPDGKFSISWDGKTPSLSISDDGGYVTAEYVYDDDVTLAYIPIFLYTVDLNNWSVEITNSILEQQKEDKKLDALSFWGGLYDHTFEPVFATLIVDVSNTDTSDGKLYARNVYINEEGDGTFAKNSYELKNGDMIEIITFVEDIETGEISGLVNTGLIIDEEFGFEYLPPHPGTSGEFFTVELEACDFNDNCSEVGPFEYRVTYEGIFSLIDVDECEKEFQSGFTSMERLSDRKYGYSIDFPKCWNLTDIFYGDGTYVDLLGGTVYPYDETPFDFSPGEFYISVLNTELYRNPLVGLTGEQYLNELIEDEKWFCDDTSIASDQWNCKNFEITSSDINSQNYDEYILFEKFTSEDESGKITNVVKIIHSIPAGGDTWELTLWVSEEFFKDNEEIINKIFDSFEMEDFVIAGGLTSNTEMDIYTEDSALMYQEALDIIREAERTVDPVLQKHRYIQAYDATWGLWLYSVDWDSSVEVHPEYIDLMESMMAFMEKKYPDYSLIPLEEEWIVGHSKFDESNEIFETQELIIEQITSELFDRGFWEPVLYDREFWLKSDGSISPEECSKLDTCSVQPDGLWIKFEGDFFDFPNGDSTTPRVIEESTQNGTRELDTDVPVIEEKVKEYEATSGGGCLIATATFGSELAPQVQQLRELRDNSLLQTESGTSFMNTFNDVYYSFSPYIADYERENPVFKEMVKIAITPMISSLSLLNYVDIDSEAEVLGYGISLIVLNLAMYVGIPASVIVGIRKIL